MPETAMAGPTITVLSQGISLALKLKQMHDTAEFRNEVKQKLQEIQEAIEEVEDGIRALAAKVDYYNVDTKLQGADVDINTTWWRRSEFRDWLQDGKPITDKGLITQIKGISTRGAKDHLVTIDAAVRGINAFSRAPWLSLFIDQLGDGPMSHLEAAYRFFSGYLAYTQIQGVLLLAAVGAEDNYAQFVHDNLVAQSKICQQVANEKLGGDERWWPTFQSHVHSYDSKKFLVGAVEPPTGGALMGLRFVTDENYNCCFMTWSAKPGSRGYAPGSAVKQGYCCGPQSVDCTNLECPTHYWADKTPVTPDRCAGFSSDKCYLLTGIGFKVSVVKWGACHGSHHCGCEVYISLDAVFRPLDEDGKLGASIRPRIEHPKERDTSWGAPCTSLTGQTQQIGDDFMNNPCTGVRLVSRDGHIHIEVEQAINANAFSAS